MTRNESEKALKICVCEQKREIEELKAENARLAEKLGQVLLAVDTVKEMNAMCNIDEQMKYAVQEFADKVKAKLLTIFGIRLVVKPVVTANKILFNFTPQVVNTLKTDSTTFAFICNISFIVLETKIISTVL